MSYIKIDIQRAVRLEDGSVGCEISIENDGASIPIVVHPIEKIYVPELIFGHMMTSSNYDDTVERFTGGRHGYGAKLTNIFSTQFTVEIKDGSRGLQYSQTFRENMSIVDEPVIQTLPQNSSQTRTQTQGLPSGQSGNFTRIVFRPDLVKFGYEQSSELDEATFQLMCRRVVDLAANLGSSGITVHLNGTPIPIVDFRQYLQICPAFYGEKKDSVESYGEGDVKSKAPTMISVEEVNVKFDLEDENIDAIIPENTETAARKEAIVFAELEKKWKIAIGPRTDDEGSNYLAGMRQISFVNSIATSRGGSHVSFILDQVCRYIVAYMNVPTRKRKLGLQGIDVILSHVRPRVTVFVSALIPNPTFDSQVKDFLLTPIRSSTDPVPSATEVMNKGKPVIGCTIPESVLKRIVSETGIVENVVEYLIGKQDRDLKKQMAGNRRKKSKELLIVEKLDDAGLAGTAQASKCTLILTEGDSAKALAVAGLAVVGRETFGVYPLKGKLLNVRDASRTQVKNNKELLEVAQILGLEYGLDYSLPENLVRLRYGSVMLMADQDHDGSHIKGLFINFIHCFWPSLLAKDGFLKEFITPIVKCIPPGVAKIGAHNVLETRQKQKAGEAAKTLSFFTLADYLAWKAKMPPKLLKRYTIKYYKGLGTSTAAEAREYFSNLSLHVISFLHESERDGHALELAFARSGANARKAWLQNLTPAIEVADAEIIDTHATTPDVAQDGSKSVAVSTSSGKESAAEDITFQERMKLLNNILTIYNFVHHELVYFSYYDTVRSIPNIMDGLKPGQRKILYGCFKRNLSQEVKVAQLSGYVAEHTGYHHGEASLNGTIVNMAQDFVFSNNLPLLSPIGQFGTRHLGGKDTASARYIFTKLEKITRKLFRAEDDSILRYNDDDGSPVEPQYFAPIIPVALINGCEGIGTGYSTNIPTFHPIDVAQNVLNRLRNKPYTPMVPYSYGFNGTIIHDPVLQDANRFVTYGKIKAVAPNVVEVTELAWGTWTNNYKQFLTSLMETGASNQASPAPNAAPSNSASDSSFTIQSFSEHHTESSVKFRISLSKKAMAYLSTVNPYEAFKLTSSIRLSNMHLFDPQHRIRLYQSPEDIFEEYYSKRLELYVQRKASMVQKLEASLVLAQSKKRFIQMVCDRSLVVFQVPIEDTRAELARLEFPQLSTSNDQSKVETVSSETSNGEPFVETGNYDYLTELPISSFSHHRIQSLQNEVSGLERSLETLKSFTPEQMWIKDVEDFVTYLVDHAKYPVNPHKFVENPVHPTWDDVFELVNLKALRKTAEKEGYSMRAVLKNEANLLTSEKVSQPQPHSQSKSSEKQQPKSSKSADTKPATNSKANTNTNTNPKTKTAPSSKEKEHVQQKTGDEKVVSPKSPPSTKSSSSSASSSSSPSPSPSSKTSSKTSSSKTKPKATAAPTVEKTPSHDVLHQNALKTLSGKEQVQPLPPKKKLHA